MTRRAGIAAVSIACALVVAGGASGASLVPTWGPVKMAGRTARILTDVSSTSITYAAKGTPTDASGSWARKVRVPDYSTSSRQTFTLAMKNTLLNGGRNFPMAEVTQTTRLTVLQKGYTEKIFSSNFDRYWNVCVKEGKDVTAQGGDVYCEVWHPKRVRMVTSATVKNYPRPAVVSETDVGPATPDCPVGAVREDTSYSWAKTIYECQDGQSVEKADGSTYLRTGNVTARVWNGRRWVNSTSTGVIKAKGPAWVKTGTIRRCSNYETTPTSYVDEGSLRTVTSGTETVVSRCNGGIVDAWSVVSRTPLPAPTVSVSSFYQATANTWRVTGTISCSYVGTYSCPYKLWSKRTDGTWGGAYDYEILTGLPAGPFSNHQFDETVYVFSGAPPNGEFAYSDTRPT